MTEEEKYRLTLYIDLVYFLMKGILNETEDPDKKEMSAHILDTWATRNAKIIKYTFDEQAKRISEDTEQAGIDEISILLSTQRLVFDSIRTDLVKILKKGVIESFDIEAET